MRKRIFLTIVSPCLGCGVSLSTKEFYIKGKRGFRYWKSLGIKIEITNIQVKLFSRMTATIRAHHIIACSEISPLSEATKHQLRINLVKVWLTPENYLQCVMRGSTWTDKALSSKISETKNNKLFKKSIFLSDARFWPITTSVRSDSWKHKSQNIIESTQLNPLLWSRLPSHYWAAAANAVLKTSRPFSLSF